MKVSFFSSRHVKLTKCSIISLTLLLVVFTFPFIIGSFTKEAKNEQLANYISSNVESNTKNKDVIGIGVSSTEKSGAIPRDEDEFYKLYGIFKQETATFASGYNFHKDNKISIPEIGISNLSVFYTGVIQSQKYNNHYKHWYYPFELMFETPRIYDISRYLIYVSESQADEFLKKKGVEQSPAGYTEDDYRSLIAQKFVINVNDVDYVCAICNVYYEYNYYFENAKELTNNFVLCSYYFPGDLARENVYFFRKYTYQNEYFMNYISNTYSNKLYDLNVIHNNLLRGIDDDYVKSFYYSDFKTSKALYVGCLVVVFALTSIVALLNVFVNRYRSLLFYVLHIVSFFVPYLVFFIISRVSNDSLYFSNYGIRLFVLLIIYYIGIHLILFLITILHNKYINKRKIYEKFNR